MREAELLSPTACAWWSWGSLQRGPLLVPRFSIRYVMHCSRFHGVQGCQAGFLERSTAGPRSGAGPKRWLASHPLHVCCVVPLLPNAAPGSPLQHPAAQGSRSRVLAQQALAAAP
jgi:hypothetical protein